MTNQHPVGITNTQAIPIFLPTLSGVTLIPSAFLWAVKFLLYIDSSPSSFSFSKYTSPGRQINLFSSLDLQRTMIHDSTPPIQQLKERVDVV